MKTAIKQLKEKLEKDVSNGNKKDKKRMLNLGDD